MPDATMIPELLHHGRAMKHEPAAGWHFAALVSRVSRRLASYIILEPGDGTRYDLVITPLDVVAQHHMGWDVRNRVLLVTRLIGGRPIGTALVTDAEPASRWDLKPIANGNDWTEELMRWWLQLVVQPPEADLDKLEVIDA